MKRFVVAACAVLSACLMLPDEHDSAHDRVLLFAGGGGGGTAGGGNIGGGSGLSDGPTEGGGSDAGADAGSSAGVCGGPGIVFGQLTATPNPLNIAAPTNGSSSDLSVTGSGSGSTMQFYGVFTRNDGSAFSISECSGSTNPCLAGANSMGFSLPVDCAGGPANASYSGTLVLCLVGAGDSGGSASVALTCTVGGGGSGSDAGLHPDAGSSGSGGNPDNSLERQTYYACSASRGAGGWPILAAIGACFLRRRRRRA